MNNWWCTVLNWGYFCWGSVSTLVLAMIPSWSSQMFLIFMPRLSNEFQEFLGTWWLIANCSIKWLNKIEEVEFNLLSKGTIKFLCQKSMQLCYFVTKSDIYFLCTFCNSFFVQVARYFFKKAIWKEFSWVNQVLSGSLLPVMGHKISSSTFSQHGICQFGSFNNIKQFIWMAVWHYEHLF